MSLQLNAMPQDPCTAAPSTTEVQLALALKDERSIYESGETIPVSLSFTATRNDRYWAPIYDHPRTSLPDIEAFCVQPQAPDPLETFLALGGFYRRAKGTIRALSATPLLTAADLNEWHPLTPGKYRVYVVSKRVWEWPDPRQQTPETRVPALVRSNPIEFEVKPPNAQWQRDQLQQALRTLSGSPPPRQARRALRQLRFLNTEQSTHELARLFYARQDSGTDFVVGLFTTPHRRLAIESLHQQLATSSRVLTQEFLDALVSLQIAAEPDANREDKDVQKHGARWLKLNQRLEEVAAWPRPTAAHRAQTLQGLLTSGGFGQELDNAIRQTIGPRWQEACASLPAQPPH